MFLVPVRDLASGSPSSRLCIHCLWLVSLNGLLLTFFDLALTISIRATGSGLTTLLIPIMLQNIGYGTFLLFGTFNISKLWRPPILNLSGHTLTFSPVAIPAVYFIYPEVCGRSLEEVNLLFTSSSILVRANEAEYRRRLAEAGGQVSVAERRLLDEVDALGRYEYDVHTASSSERGDSLHGEKGVPDVVYQLDQKSA